MFRSLADKLAGVFDKLKGRGLLTEDIVNDSMREIRIALLEADVALPVVKTFIASVKEKAVGQEEDCFNCRDCGRRWCGGNWYHRGNSGI